LIINKKNIYFPALFLFHIVISFLVITIANSDFASSLHNGKGFWYATIDASKYHSEAIIQLEYLKNSDWISWLLSFPSHHNVKAISFSYWVTGTTSLYSYTVFSAFIWSFSVLLIFKSTRLLFPGNYFIPFISIIFFLQPSILFNSTQMLRDPFFVLGICSFIYGWVVLEKDYPRWNWFFYILFGFILTVSMRDYLMPVFAIPTIIYMVWVVYKKRWMLPPFILLVILLSVYNSNFINSRLVNLDIIAHAKISSEGIKTLTIKNDKLARQNREQMNLNYSINQKKEALEILFIEENLRLEAEKLSLEKIYELEAEIALRANLDKFKEKLIEERATSELKAPVQDKLLDTESTAFEVELEAELNSQKILLEKLPDEKAAVVLRASDQDKLLDAQFAAFEAELNSQKILLEKVAFDKKNELALQIAADKIALDQKYLDDVLFLEKLITDKEIRDQLEIKSVNSINKNQFENPYLNFAFSMLNSISKYIGNLRYDFASISGTSGSSIDPYSRFFGIYDLVNYFPRATQIGFLAPFPSDWLTNGDQVGRIGKVLAAFEMILWYVILSGFIWALFEKLSIIRPLLPVFFFSFTVIILLGYGVPNVGALFRMRQGYMIPFYIIGFYGLQLLYFKWHSKK